jgi:hypothetical protein
MTPDCERFWVVLQQMALPKKTATLAQCWDALRILGGAYDPTLTDRSRLHAFLDQLRVAARILLPSKNNAANWNREGSPTLPKTIRFVRTPSPEFSDFWATRTWHEITACLADHPGSRRYSAEIVHIERFLSHGGMQRAITPMNERSAEVFGDEKRLGTLRNTILFQAGRLDLERHLRCRPTPPPIPWERGSGSESPLIIENSTTYWSICRWNRIHNRWRAVIYGCGNQITGQTETLIELAREEHWTCYQYFGDLDPSGVNIPTQVADALAQVGIAVIPDYGLYQLLLNRRVGWQQQRKVEPGHISASALEWLGPLAEQVRVLITSGEYAPQELVGTDTLKAWVPLVDPGGV